MKPILFSTPMVQAILAGRKTQTRRLMKPQPDCPYIGFDGWRDSPKGSDMLGVIHKIPYRIGENLWIRETWAEHQEYYNDGSPVYKIPHFIYKADGVFANKWRPSIFMPREAARIFLRVTDVRAERLQNITPSDCAAEGIFRDVCHYNGHKDCNCVDDYSVLWDSLNSKRGYGWNVNPWVWVISFEHVEKLDVLKG